MEVAVAVLVGGALLAAVGWRMLRRRRRAGGGGGARAAAVLAAHGPARCTAALELLRRLARRGDQRAIAAALDAVEMPLLQAIPDCPPPLKPELVDALDACARLCANRALAKRLVDLRNALLNPGAG